METQIVICNLQNYMDKHELNISQLSRELGITQNAIRGYVKNRFSRIDCQIAGKLCDYFGCSFGEMFELPASKAA